MSDEGVLRLFRKLANLAAGRGLRFELEFDDQQVEIDGDAVTLNGSTVLRGESEDDER